MKNVDYFFKHDLILSPEEHWVLIRALSHALMSFRDTDTLRGLDGTELQEFQITKDLYKRISGSSADNLLKTYQKVKNNPYEGDGCPF